MHHPRLAAMRIEHHAVNARKLPQPLAHLRVIDAQALGHPRVARIEPVVNQAPHHLIVQLPHLGFVDHLFPSVWNSIIVRSGEPDPC